jgi:hypothetical protein
MNADGSLALCGYHASCQTDGTCLQASVENGACATDGPLCVWPSSCGADARCHLPTVQKTCGPAAPPRPAGRLPPDDARFGIRGLFANPLHSL